MAIAQFLPMPIHDGGLAVTLSAAPRRSELARTDWSPPQRLRLTTPPASLEQDLVLLLSIDLRFREAAVRAVTDEPGCYVLCDLDGVAIYVGRSSNIRSRVRRHITSARSDIIANRQIDVWEVAYVITYLESDPDERLELEFWLYHQLHMQSPLMNGRVPTMRRSGCFPSAQQQRVQVMSDDEIAEKSDPANRLPRQAAHYSQIVGHYLAVKKSIDIALAMNAHFVRLRTYHARLLGLDE